MKQSELQEKLDKALGMLENCTACPRNCKVNRLKDKIGVCRIGRFPIVSSHFPHMGEEDCLRGWNGSGTIFFSGCNLRCIFCQNFEISWELQGETVTPEESAGMMLHLQSMGCHNINFVTPEHVVPQIIESLYIAIHKGLKIPIVYNTSAYDSLHSLKLMDGIVDIYMPDFKFWNRENARKYIRAPDYPEVARKAIKEMHRQVGDLELDGKGIARRGLLVRHLVMPHNLAGTREILNFLYSEISPNTFVNIMAQYHPAGKAHQYPELSRRIRPEEFVSALKMAEEIGLRRIDKRSRDILYFNL